MLYTLLGTKIGMTQVFDSEGRSIPVTVIKTGPCPVVQIKTEGRDGYSCLQIGYGEVKAGNVSKSERGHTIKAKVDPLRRLKEIRLKVRVNMELEMF